jgi:hypothetical protein
VVQWWRTLWPPATQTHHIILISVKGLDQIHCALCWEQTDLKTQSVVQSIS